jgi:hypothetical protein
MTVNKHAYEAAMEILHGPEGFSRYPIPLPTAESIALVIERHVAAASLAGSWVPTKEQLASLCNLILRYAKAPDEMNTHAVGLPGVIMVRFNELWIGIELDGYAHS